MTMRRSPRRPLILKRRKLPFQQKEGSPKLHDDKVATQDAPQATSSLCIPDGVCIMDHPSMSATQVVVVPKTADLQTVIGALTAKGKECGAQGPNKFILLSGTNPSLDEKNVSSKTTNEQISFQDVKHLTALKPLGKDLECGPLDDSLTNIQWLGRMSTCSLETRPAKPIADKENLNVSRVSQSCNAEASLKQPLSERPPYSYMAMIQFAINSKQTRKMTLKEIYMWIEDHFPYFRQVAKPGWKNSIRHNLSLHDMFIRETSADGKVSYWTIRPEANRCLTLDQVYKQQKRILPDANKTPFSNERKMKPLLPRTDSYLVPIQLPVSSTVYMPPSSSSAQHKRSISCGAKKVRIAPKVSINDVPAVDMKEEAVEVLIKSPTTEAVPKRPTRSSRRKQCLVHSLHEEPVLLCHSNTFFDSGVVSDISTFHDLADMESNGLEKLSPNRDLSFKTPIKSSNHLTSSTPSKAPSNVLPEQWKVTPVSKQRQTVLDFSPIRTPGDPAVTPRHDYTTYSFSSTPFKDLPLFSSPRQLLTAPVSKLPDSPGDCPRNGCSRELLQAGSATPNNRSVTEGLVLDTMNDSLSKILVDISFSGLDDDDLGMTNISWSEFIPQLK
uniref:Forkhead box protein M1 n=1 Tax=Neogobius melanostomus TaxID=47308 RepID=A0A8C6SBU9_9GOBI